MDRFQYYLEVVPIYALVGLPIILLALLLATPGKYRMGACIALSVVWMALGRMPELNLIQAIAKATVTGSFMLICITALFHPGAKLRLPPIVWLYPATAIMSMAYVFTVEDRTLAIVLRFNFFLLVMSALLVARTVTDTNAFHYVLRAICIGLMVALLIPLSSLVVDPSASFVGGLRRFTPYGANPNQVGTLFLLSGPICLYFAFKDRFLLWRIMVAGACALAAGMGLLTSSRSVIFFMAVPMIVILKHNMRSMRNVIMLVILAVIAVLILGLVLGQAEGESDFSRLGNLETERWTILVLYLQEFLSRPLFGLMFSRGMMAQQSEAIGFHPHNVYMETLYVGGISYAVFVFYLMFKTVYSGVYLWLKRKQLQLDPQVVALFAGMMPVFYLHGMVNSTITYPTYTWAIVYVLFSVLLITWASAASATSESY